MKKWQKPKPTRKHTNIIADLVREARREADLKDQALFEQLTLESGEDAERAAEVHRTDNGRC